MTTPTDIEALRQCGVGRMIEPMLFLRTTDKDGKSYGGFQWPLEVGATVTAPDWDAKPVCGKGLHGLLNGEGDASHLSPGDDAIWWIVEATDAVDLLGKHKFQTCKVIAFGKRSEVTPMLRRMTGTAVHYLMETAGNRSTLTGGDGSTLTGGDRSTLTGGDYSTLTGGDGSTLTGGDRSTLTGGDRSTLTGGDGSTLTGGDGSTLTGGDYSTLTGGYGSTLTGGDRSTLTGGNCSTLTGGDGSTLIFLRWKDGRRRVLTAYAGEGGIKPGHPYRADDDFTAVVPASTGGEEWPILVITDAYLEEHEP
jgi:hypothetical protein